MSIEQNKQLVREFVAVMNDFDLTAFVSLFTEDALWRIPGRPEKILTAGDVNRDQAGLILAHINSRMKAGLCLTIKSLTAEEDCIAAEIDSDAEFEDGRPYRQQYFLFIEFQKGKIFRVRMYFDTNLEYDTWFRRDSQQ